MGNWKEMASFWWFMLTAHSAAVMVGLATLNVVWGVTTLVVLFALRNAVMAGYVEGRVRYDHEFRKRSLAKMD